MFGVTMLHYLKSPTQNVMYVSELFKVVGAYLPPPAGLKSPALWGTEPHIVELFGPQAVDIRCVRKHFNFRYRSAAHFIEVFRTWRRLDAKEKE